MTELPPLPDLPTAQRWTTALVIEYACSYAEQAVNQEREAIAAMFDDSPNAEMFRQDIAAAIRSRSEQGKEQYGRGGP